MVKEISSQKPVRRTHKIHINSVRRFERKGSISIPLLETILEIDNMILYRIMLQENQFAFFTCKLIQNTQLYTHVQLAIKNGS